MDSTTPNIAASIAPASTPAKQGTSTAKVASDQSRSDAASAPTEQAGDPQRDPRSLQFQVEGGRVVTTVVDENNQTVVVQIPDAEVIRIAKAIDRMQGFLVEGKA